jgi:hypothetical protein
VASAQISQLRHDTWAALRLIASVRDRPAAVRAWTVPGTRAQ